MVYRTTPQETKRLIPSLLLFERKTAMPMDVLIKQPPDQLQEVTTYVQELHVGIERAIKIARQHLKQAGSGIPEVHDCMTTV